MMEDYSKDKYNELIREINLKEVFLHKVQTIRNNYNEDIDHKILKQVNVNFKEKDSTYTILEEQLSVLISYELIMAITEKNILEMHFSFIAVYELNNAIDITDKEFELFSNKNAPINVWPYTRQFVSYMTTTLGLPHLFLNSRKS